MFQREKIGESPAPPAAHTRPSRTNKNGQGLRPVRHIFSGVFNANDCCDQPSAESSSIAASDSSSNNSAAASASASA